MLAKRLDLPFDPLGAARRFGDRDGLAFLHSGLRAYGLGRYSILASEPVGRIRYSSGLATLWDETGERRIAGDFPDALESLLGEPPPDRGRLPFFDGIIGYLSYEAGRSLEPGSFQPRDHGMAESRFFVYDAAVVFDHQAQETYVVARSESGQRRWEAIESDLRRPTEPLLEPFRLTGELKSNFERSEFLNAVSRVRGYIRDGEVYQVNLSQRFEADCAGAGLALFCDLARKSPAPYAAYLNFGDEQIISSSPERFLKVDGHSVTTRPIKGTCPVGESDEATLRNERRLAASEKDRSELLMIVDLERNDLGRVCEPGSVTVDGLFGLERYATVIHQTADVSGELERGKDVFDCLRAMFPGGSITGAPKIRAMQIIEELERGPRGVYTGAIGYLDRSGDADLNIAIRTLRIADGALSFQVGGGIVWDSDPESEYEETLIKAKAMRLALGIDE